MKRLGLAVSLVACAALLSGCIIVPPRHGGYRDGYGRGYHQGGYGAGAVYVQPGPQR